MNTKSVRDKTTHSQKNNDNVGNQSAAYNPNFGDLFDNILEGVMLIGFDWTCLYVNEAAAQHAHKARSKLAGRALPEMYPNFEQTATFTHFRDCMENRTPRRFEANFTFPDGTEGWYEFSVEPVMDGIFILSLDVTESRQAEDELHENEWEFSRMFHSNILPIAMVDKDTGRYFDVNEANARMLEYTREELIGHSPMELMIFARPEQFYALWEELKEKGSLHNREVMLRTKSGKILTCLFSSHWDQHQGVDYLVTVARDITGDRRAELQQQEAPGQLLQERDVLMSMATEEEFSDGPQVGE